ncbi:hypothetical protein L6164_024704 [Bauhinia variegata]|uniref:Uncharacterized protein n=1 Tax=Bauhinia variegata TaxID=167791 RepID=A0ACB9M0U4_BAUVA|nr:hypothetical protein L6164_024704 [Bauhinia variegata]
MNEAGKKMQSEGNARRPAKQQQSMGFPAPQLKEPLPCPRCDSTTTKFCYYNNYNLCQPRYFCKSCRRYWTHGGTLRNVPVGGGTRKASNKSRTNSNSFHSPATACSSVFDVPCVKQTETASKSGDLNINHKGPLLSLNSEAESSRGFSFGGCDEVAQGLDGTGSEMSGGGVGPFSDFGDYGGALPVPGPSSEYNIWQLSAGLLPDSDFLGWPNLAISTPDLPPKNLD